MHLQFTSVELVLITEHIIDKNQFAATVIGKLLWICFDTEDRTGKICLLQLCRGFVLIAEDRIVKIQFALLSFNNCICSGDKFSYPESRRAWTCASDDRVAGLSSIPNSQTQYKTREVTAN